MYAGWQDAGLRLMVGMAQNLAHDVQIASGW